MAVSGMDIEAVRTLAQQFSTKSDEITNIATQLSSQLHQVTWEGADAQRFKSDWEGQYQTALRQVADALKHASTAATSNANQQAEASA